MRTTLAVVNVLDVQANLQANLRPVSVRQRVLRTVAPGLGGGITVMLQPESTIMEGIPAGSGRGQVADNWAFSFSKYIVSVGNVRIARDDVATPLTLPAYSVIDLKTVGAAGLQLGSFPQASVGQWRNVGYGLAAPSNDSVRHASVSQDDFDEMVAMHCSHLVVGMITNPNGRSMPVGGAPRAATSIAFHWCVDVNVQYGPCANQQGQQGVNVIAGTSTTVALSLHGDHLSFPGFPSDESILVRRGQWLANADANGDNTVTRSELATTQASVIIQGVFPASALTGSPIQNIQTGWDYVRAQFAAQGHYNGEGQCTATVEQP